MVLTTQTANSRVRRPERAPDAEHVTIYYDPDYHASAEFNHNFWVFPDGGLSRG